MEEIITKDISILKELQKKMKFEQERTKNIMPEIREKIEPDEYIYLCAYSRVLGNKYYFVATDKKLIKYHKGRYWEAPLSEVVSIGRPKAEMGIFCVTTKFDVNTFHEQVTFEFINDAANCGHFYAAVNQALNNYNLRKKDIRAIICSLKFKDEEQKKT